jgi:hypothetical protein
MAGTKRGGRTTPREWAISALVHGIIFGLLIWLLPVRQLLSPSSPAASKTPTKSDALSKLVATDPGRVEEVIQSIQEKQKEQAAATVSQLLDSEKQIDDMVKLRLDALGQQTAEISAAAPQAALDQMKSIAQFQADAAKAQQDLTTKLQALAVQAQAARQAVDPATALQKMVTDLPQEEKDEEQLRQSVKESQMGAQDAQEKAAQLLKFVAAGYAESASAQDAANTAQASATDNQQQVIDHPEGGAQKMAEALSDALQAVGAQTDANPVKALFDQSKKAEDGAKAKVAATTGPDLDAAKKNLEQTSNARAKAENDFAQAQGKADRLKQQADFVFAIAGDSARASDSQQKADQDQLAAQKAQADAMTKLAAAVTSGAPKAGALAETSPLSTLESEPDLTTLDGKDLAELFEEARKTEERVAEKYKMFRAAELASIRKITLAEALKDTEVARPDREKLNLPLLASNGKNTDLTAYKSEVEKADQQLASINALIEDMLAAMEDQSQQAGSGSIDVSNWLKAQGDQFSQQQAMATAGGGDMAGRDLTEIGGARSYPRDAPELPAMDYANLKPYATRRISESGPHHSDWVYVDSWYVIGPFPNEGRRNLYTKFPPESIIDLNATYPGKYNHPISWQYLKWDTPKIEMAHDVEDAPAIYYAYTELSFDQPHDLWIATGSDDKGIMWLNDVMVWNSGDNLKSWLPNEGYRKVHFQKGVNRILYRLENGQLSAELSLMIAMKP